MNAFKAIDSSIQYAEKMIALLADCPERASRLPLKLWREELARLNEMKASVTELAAALPPLMALYRLKWGNLDPDALKVYERVEAAMKSFPVEN